MKKYIVNKDQRGPLIKQIEFEAASHDEKGSFIEFYDDDGQLVKSIKESMVRTIDIE